VSSYSSGTAAVFPILLDGSIGANKQVVNHTNDAIGAKVHQTVLDNGRAFVMDLGLDAIYQYDVDSSGILKIPEQISSKIELTKGSG